MKKFEHMISLEEAFGIFDATMADVKPMALTLAVQNAISRVLIADQRSRHDLPPFDRAAMDGFAVLFGDQRDEYEVLETVLAGHVGKKALVQGTAVKIMTGAVVPDGAGRIIKIEDTREHDGKVTVTSDVGEQISPRVSSNICRRGEDVCIGELVVSAGAKLGPLEIANLISCGITQVEVARCPRVSILSTGDEIVNSFDALAPGKIMNSNGPMLAALAKEYALEVIAEKCIPDDKDATENAILEAVQSSDITILTGGVSVGESDFVLGALTDVGFTVHFSRIRVQPGKPTVYAISKDGKVVFGLPGNPVAAYLMFHLFVLRAADLMTGKKHETMELKLRLACAFERTKAERLLFIPARLTVAGMVEPIAYHGSAHLAALMSADGFVRIAQGVDKLQEGDEVAFLPIMGYRRW